MQRWWLKQVHQALLQEQHNDMTPDEQSKIVVPKDYKFEPAIDSRPEEYDIALNSRPNSANTPLSELFNPEDDNCPICHKKMIAGVPGAIPRNPQGFVVCRDCIRKNLPD